MNSIPSLTALLYFNIISLSLSIFLFSDNLSFTLSVSSPTHFLTSSSIVVYPNFTIFRVTRLTVSLSSLPLNNSSRLSSCILISTLRHLSSPSGLPILIFLSLSPSLPISGSCCYSRFFLLLSSHPHVLTSSLPPALLSSVHSFSLSLNFVFLRLTFFHGQPSISLSQQLSTFSLSIYSFHLPHYRSILYPPLVSHFPPTPSYIILLYSSISLTLLSMYFP